MPMKCLVFFILAVVLLEAKLNIGEDLSFFQKTILNYLFPKDLGIVRVRKSEEVKTMNVTILDFIGLVERHGYFAEEHYVTTEDGYNLIIHRISGSPLSKNQKRKKIVFFQSGLFATSDTWVLIGPGKDLAFLLADEGYDIWLGNFRGSSYCRSHIKISPQNKEFWQFSYHEIGTRDLPAMIDYVLNYTNQKTVRYVGLSMGTTVLFTFLSMRPEYNAKIKLGICFGPIAIWKEISPIMEYFIIGMQFFDHEIYEIFPLSSTSITMKKILCGNEAITQPICVALIFLLVGSDPTQLNTTILPEIALHYPAGSSMQTLFHYYQNMITKKFQAYDYGYFGNYNKYKQITPIMYDLKKVTAPLALFYGSNDMFALKSNVLELYKHLPNVILLEENPYKLFNHMDFLWAIDAKTLIYDRSIKLLKEFDNQE